MSDFPPPFDPPALTVPNPEPEVGEGSPWVPADGENRDRILDWWRAWWRRVFFPWLTNFLTTLNDWLAAVEAYIIEHAISGYSFRTTATDIAGTGTTDVTFTDVDTEHRPIVIGDLVLDQSTDGNWGIVTVVIDDTHATVEFLGSLRGPQGIPGPTGPQGDPGIPGVVQTIVPGTGVTVDSTDPANPVVSAIGRNGGDLTKALVIGTSISAGTYTGGVSWVDYFPDAYAARAVDAPGPIVLDNQSQSGYNSAQLYPILLATIGDEPYGYVFIEVNVNDYKNATIFDAHGTGLSDVNHIKVLTQMITLCRDRGAEPILIGTAPWVPGEFADFHASPYRQSQMNFAWQRLSTRLGVKYVDLLTKLDLLPDNLIEGFHPSLLGQELWAAAIAAATVGIVSTDIYDDFVRPDNALRINPSYSGTSWQPDDTATFAIAGNLAKCLTGDGSVVRGRVAPRDPAHFPSDGDLDDSCVTYDMQLSAVIVANNGSYCARWNAVGEANNGYILNPSGGAVYYDIGAGPVSIGTFTPMSVEDQFVWTIAGSTIDVEVNGVSVLHLTDTHVPAGWFAGLYSAGVSGPSQRRWGPLAVTAIGTM